MKDLLVLTEARRERLNFSAVARSHFLLRAQHRLRPRIVQYLFPVLRNESFEVAEKRQAFGFLRVVVARDLLLLLLL